MTVKTSKKGGVENPMDVANIKAYLKPEFLAKIPDEYLTKLCEGVWDYVSNYTNWPVNTAVPAGLVMVCADLVGFYYGLRPEYEEMQTDDMHLVFKTTMPDSVLVRLTQYRRLRW